MFSPDWKRRDSLSFSQLAAQWEKTSGGITRTWSQGKLDSLLQRRLLAFISLYRKFIRPGNMPHQVKLIKVCDSDLQEEDSYNDNEQMQII